MRILIDIGHPAHVHYFRNFIKLMQDKGHEFILSARDKETTFKLLDYYSIKYLSRGSGGKNIFSKLLKLPIINLRVYFISKKFHPDIFLSFASPYAAHIARLLDKPHIAFDDTEHAVMAQKLYRPFTSVILSPSCYYKKPCKNQLFFNSFMELCYLHPKYFSPDKRVLDLLGIQKNERYVIIRFVSWNANHDVGQKGLSYGTKLKLVDEISKHCKVFISSEGPLPSIFEKFKLNIPPNLLHDALFYASLYIGEGSTTASESAILGTEAIYVNSLVVGYCLEEEKIYNLCHHIVDEDSVIEMAIEILSNPDSKIESQKKRAKLLREKIDPTSFMVWFVENYPESVRIMKDNPGDQNQFK